MKDLYNLKEMLCNELEEYGRKGELTAGSLDIVDKLAHTVKNIDKIIEMYEGGEMPEGNSYGMGGYYPDNTGSYARGRGARRDSMGRYSSRGYSMNNYSRGGDMRERIQELMNDAPDDMTRQELQRIMSKL